MAIKQVMMYKANDGTLHESEEKAKSHNGMAALRDDLRTNFQDGSITIEQIMDNFARWYLLFLQESK